MKTTIFTLAIILLSFISFNVSATNNSDETTTPDQVTTSYLFSHSLEVFEEELTIEPWMTDDQLWSSSTNTTFSFENELNEEELTIESWMTNNELWKVKSKKEALINQFSVDNHTYYIVKTKKEKEQPLRIEKWMTDDQYWSL